MKRKGVKLSILGVILFSSCLGILSNNFSSIIFLDEKIDDTNGSNLKSAGFWDLTGSQILIDDSDPNKNWSYTASHYDWCSGSGNWTEPYLIENVTINGQGLYSCIEIRNSHAFFIIRNCTLYNAWFDGGIYLNNTNNGKLIDNVVNNNFAGIFLHSSVNNTLSGNIANNNSEGIYLHFSDNNTLLGNTANNNIGFGVELHASNNNTLSGNTANNNNWAGIQLDGHNNTLSGNTANNNIFYGIYLWNSSYNTLSGNTANYNAYGIGLRNSNYNLILGNGLIGNDECIEEENCQGNTFSGNDCTNGEQSIPGYNLFFLLGILSVIAIFIRKKVK